MRTEQLENVDFGILPPVQEGAPYILTFTDWAPAPGPNGEVVRLGIGQTQILFDAGGWENFKRHVAADGAISSIQIANGMPRMDIPKGS